MRFRRIKRISEEILNEPVEIHLSSALEDEIGCIALVNNSLHIFVNSNICKSEEQVVATVVHEIAHKLSKTKYHDNEYYRNQDKVAEVFSSRMNIPKENLDKLLSGINVKEILECSGRYQGVRKYGQR